MEQHCKRSDNTKLIPSKQAHNWRPTVLRDLASTCYVIKSKSEVACQAIHQDFDIRRRIESIVVWSQKAYVLSSFEDAGVDRADNDKAGDD